MAKRRKDAGQATEGRPVVRRERSELTRAVAELERAQKRRPPLFTKLVGLEVAKASLATLDEEIASLQAAVVRIMKGPALEQGAGTGAG